MPRQPRAASVQRIIADRPVVENPAPEVLWEIRQNRDGQGEALIAAGHHLYLEVRVDAISYPLETE